MSHLSHRRARFSRSRLCAAALLALSSQAFAATYTFNSGSYTPGTTAPNALGAGDVLNIGAGGTKYFSGATLTNGGTVNWSADTLYLSSFAIDNSGLWNASSDDTLYYYSGNQPTFVNSGTFRKSAGSGATNIGSVVFTNSGTVDAQTGSIVLGGGNTSFLAGSQFTGAGVVAITNNASFSGAFGSANLALQSGTFTGSNAVLNGTVNFSGGQLAGDWTVAGGQQLLLQGGSTKYIVGGSLNNQGTLRWLGGTDNLYLGSVAISNANLFDVQGNLTLYYYTGNQPTFTNTGTVQVAAGNTLTVGGLGFVNNGGTLKTGAGATINFSGSNTTFNAGTQFSGAGTTLVSSNARFVGDFTSQNLVLQGGTFSAGDGVTAGTAGNAAVALKGAVAFNSGTLQGNWNIGVGNTLTMNAGSTKYITNAAIANGGTMVWAAGADNLYLGSASIANSGSVNVQDDLTLYYYTGNQPTFTNTGTVTVAAGRTLTVGGIGFVNNGGTLDAAAGATINYAGGSATFNAGTTFSGAGTQLVTNNASFVGAFNAQNLVLQSGTFTGGDGTANSRAVLNGNVALTSGTLTGDWQVAAGQSLTVRDGSTKYISNATLTNQGTLTWQTGDTAYLGSSTLVNQGKFDLKSDAQLYYYSGNQSSLVNSGLLVKSAGTGTSDLSTIGVTNTGTIEVQTGTIHLPDAFANAGTLKGNGTLQSATLTNNGHLAPGSGIGTLTLAGNYVQGSSGFLDSELQSRLGTDLFLVTGNATLGGTLALHCFASCQFTAGDEVVLLDATGTVNGTFANVTLDGFQSGAFTVVYDTLNGRVLLDVTQNVTAAVPEPQNGVLMFAGLAALVFVARRRRAIG